MRLPFISVKRAEAQLAECRATHTAFFIKQAEDLTHFRKLAETREWYQNKWEEYMKAGLDVANQQTTALIAIAAELEKR